VTFGFPELFGLWKVKKTEAQKLQEAKTCRPLVPDTTPIGQVGGAVVRDVDYTVSRHGLYTP